MPKSELGTQEVAEPGKYPSEIVEQVLAEESDPEDPVDPEEDPVDPEEDPVDPEEDPVDPEEDPVDPEEDPVDPEEDPENEEVVKDLPEETQARVQKRFGQLTKARKEAEGRADDLQTQLDAKDSDVADLEDRLEASRKGGSDLPVASALMAAVTSKDLDAAEDKLDEMIEWCEDHVDEGFEDEENGQEMKPAEIRKRLRALRKVETRVVPKAREVLKKRATAEADAKKSFPELFDKNKPEGQRYRRMLLDHPELKAVPDLPLILGAAFAHESGKKAAPKKLVKKAPAAPAASPAPKKKDVLDPAEKKAKPVNLDRVISSGGSADSVAGAILNMDIDI